MTNALFFLIYSVSLACLAFFLGALWQDRRMLKYVQPPPLPEEIKSTPPPTNVQPPSVSPYAPKPKTRLQQHILGDITKKERIEKWEKGKDNSPSLPPEASTQSGEGKATFGPNYRLPDIPWGSNNEQSS